MVNRVFHFATLAALTALLAAGTGCKELPGSPGAQGAAIGGLGGAAAGAAIGGPHDRALGAVLGGALGAAGGYVIGANSDKIFNRDKDGASKATSQAQNSPATPAQAKSATTADVNGDGFVTMDEVVAMQKAGFTDAEIIDRLRATGQVFELTAEQKNYLLTNGVSQNVVSQMPELNREVRDRVLNQTTPTGRDMNQPVPPPPSTVR